MNIISKSAVQLTSLAFGLSAVVSLNAFNASAAVYPLAHGDSLEDVAQLSPSHLDPDLEGVQATNLRVVGPVVFVTYNTAGPGSTGAFEAIDISDIRHPRPLSVLKYDSFEFADVAIEGHRAYIVGQENTPSHQGAVLKMIDVTCPRFLIDLGSLPLDSYAATSIRIHDNKALVSTGDDGSIEVLDLQPFALPMVQDKIPFANALFSTSAFGHYYALGGANSTKFVSFSPLTGEQQQSVQLSGSETPSPARFQLLNGIAYINAESSGFSLVSLGSFSLLSQTSVPGIGNGLDVVGHRAFLAQGDEGLYLVDVRDKSSPEIIGNLNFHYAGESTNQVRYYRDGFCEYLLVANGSGGLRIFKLNFQ